MNLPRSKNPVATALYLNAGLLLVIALLLARRSPGLELTPSAMAQAQPPIAGGAGVYVMPAQFHEAMWGCYLLDTNNQTLCTYEYAAGERVLKLTSARKIAYDTQLQNFATFPKPWEVQKMVDLEKKDQRERDSKPPVVNPEAPPPGQ